MGTTAIRKILMATDFSAESDSALEVVLSLARALDASVELVHVAELTLQEFPLGLTFYNVDQGGYFAYVSRALATRADRVRAAGIPCEVKSLEGRAPAEIVRRAKEAGADLIVMGTHGRTGVAHVVLGSVAERVVQRAPCPVLTVPPAKQSRPTAKI